MVADSGQRFDILTRSQTLRGAPTPQEVHGRHRAVANLVSDTPIARSGDAEDAAARLIQDWEGRGYAVKIRSERSIDLRSSDDQESLAQFLNSPVSEGTPDAVVVDLAGEKWQNPSRRSTLKIPKPHGFSMVS